MPTNVNTAVGPSIQPAGRTAETKTDRIAINKDGGSSSAFAKQTDVKFTNSVDNMSAVLDKVANSRLGTEAVLPKQLQQMINNVVRNAFSLESSLGEGLGSAMASERYSIEQLTTLGRIFQQLGSMAEVNAASSGQLAGMQDSGGVMAGELTDALQVMMANIRNLVGEGILSGNSGNLELVQLNKLAFQLLNSGSTEGMPGDFVRLLQQLSGQLMAAGQAPQAAVQEDGAAGALKQLIDVLFPRPLTAGNSSAASSSGTNVAGGNAGNAAGSAAGGSLLNAGNGMPAANSGAAATNINTGIGSGAGQGVSVNVNGGANVNTAADALAGGSNAGSATGTGSGGAGMGAAAGAGGAANVNANGNTAANTDASANGQAKQAGQMMTGRESGVQENGGRQSVSANANAGANPNPNANALQGNTSHQAAELENNPLFRQIFSRYGYTQETGVVKNPQHSQQQAPQLQLANNQQTVAAFKDMAQLLLKDSSMTAKDVQLLQDFVNGSQEALSQQDAKQLNLLLRMVQSNIPAAVQQAGQQQGMEGLPKLWAFLQLAELGTLKGIRAKELKNASKEIRTVISSMKGAVSSEGSYRADGQKSISFVMPLYIGENEQSYPAYINLYDEPSHEDEQGRTRKDTWFRVCVLTENIGAVDIVCQLYEGNNLNLRIQFSDQEAVRAFGEYLPDIRKALYDTSVHLNDLRVGTVK
ncbi:hypothetical protein [Anaerovibrio sp.]|uniref:hypothetical protein n=1 Tax=Anaerovibrio sp. TaxID=1872532 RepID=UPI003F13CC9A